MSRPHFAAFVLTILTATQAAAQADSQVTVPMLDVGGRPVVELSINGSGPYRFILDTGASRTVVADDLIAELKLPAINGADSGPVRIDTLGLDTLMMTDVTVARGGAMLAGLNGQVRGVLSAQAFPGSLLTLDFIDKRVSVRRGELPPADGRRIFAYDADDPLPRVPVRIDGTEYRLHFDTGAPAGMSLPLARARTLGLEGQLVERGRARVVTGVFPVFEAPFTGRIELGDFVLPITAISFSDLRPGPAPPPGLIGMKLLQDFVITLDTRNRRVRFEKPAA
jgi:hypothetical protein